MSHEDLLKKVPASAPKEEQRIDELSIPSGRKKAGYNDLIEQLAPQDQKMLGVIKDYDEIKRTTNGEKQDLKNSTDIQANLLLNTKNPDGMAKLKKKVEDKSHLLTMPRKV